MTLFIKNSRSILFLHVPKCGGSSIDRLFKDDGYFSTLEMRGLPPQDCLIASPQHQTCKNLKSMINMESLEDIFIVTRNPYKRIISEFNWQYRDAEPCDKPDINAWILKSLEQASSDLSYSDNHFRPSVDFIDSGYPCKVFKLEDGIEFVAEYFIREDGSTNKIDMPNEKDAKSFTNSISEPNLSPIAIAKINQFYKDDFEAFGYTRFETEIETSELEIGRENNNLATNEKIKAVKKWREITLNALYGKIQQELGRLDTKISQTSNFAQPIECTEKVDHAEIQKSTEACFDEILVKLKYFLLKQNLTESPEKIINATAISNMIELANQFRYQSELKTVFSRTGINI